ncbi:MAG: methylated-DNA--[protein]-cysteine S-methyltransferase [Gallionella sp.]|nr:methylated-DNA--[protein]-cysteine S-methyltransferase [Gallionella sp.]MDD4957728.1 methylated-DNA--[protein]-cysteine S-methyltransferase [Gallionella sp.]
MPYQALFSTPFAILGIRCTDDALTEIVFLPLSTPAQSPSNDLAAEVCWQLLRYVDDPAAPFDLPLAYRATPHQAKVWRALCEIPCGETRQYGELAKTLHSAAQAVGQACGANPLPIVIPCHRVVSSTGLGGFMLHRDGDALDIKRWLLAHERAI